MIIAIENCDSREQYQRLVKIGSMCVPNLLALSDDFIDKLVGFHKGTVSEEELQDSTDALGNAVDDAHFDLLWGIIFRIALRRRKA